MSAPSEPFDGAHLRGIIRSVVHEPEIEASTREGLPWEREHSAHAWAATLSILATSPAGAARALPVGAPLRPAIRLAAISVAVHLVVSSLVRAAITYWSVSAVLERFGAPDSVGRIIVLSDATHAIASNLLATPLAVCAAPALLTLAARICGIRIPIDESARAVAYASGLLAVASVPIVGWISVRSGPAFLFHWLGTRSVARPKRIIIVVLSALALLLLTAAIDELYSRTIADPLSDIALEALA